MGLQQFERRLERLVEGVFARAFRSGLQPVEVGRRLAREMDLRRTVAPRGTLAPNAFRIVLSEADYNRFAPIRSELVQELVQVARDHAHRENYLFLGPVEVTLEQGDDMKPGMLLVAGDIVAGQGTASLVLPDGRKVVLDRDTVVLGRLPECELVLADPNVSRRHAEIRRVDGGGWMLVDLGSTNGTKVNELRVNGTRPLEDGDTVSLGATTLRFEAG
jgi:hypothetical protein